MHAEVSSLNFDIHKLLHQLNSLGTGLNCFKEKINEKGKRIFCRTITDRFDLLWDLFIYLLHFTRA